MGILDIFSKKNKVVKENNTLFGQTQLGNQIVRQQQDGQVGANFQDRKSTRLNSSHIPLSRMPSSA